MLCGMGAEEGTERALLAAAEAANERIASCHEVEGCPKCGMPVGVRCVRMLPSGFLREPFVHTKHPHRERWTLVVPAR